MDSDTYTVKEFACTRPGCAFVVFPLRKVGQHVGRPTVSHLVVVDKMNMELSLNINILKIHEFGRILGRPPHFARKIEKKSIGTF